MELISATHLTVNYKSFTRLEKYYYRIEVVLYYYFIILVPTLI